MYEVHMRQTLTSYLHLSQRSKSPSASSLLASSSSRGRQGSFTSMSASTSSPLLLLFSMSCFDAARTSTTTSRSSCPINACHRAWTASLRTSKLRSLPSRTSSSSLYRSYSCGMPTCRCDRRSPLASLCPLPLCTSYFTGAKIWHDG
jgi:hypothetical protein